MELVAEDIKDFTIKSTIRTAASFRPFVDFIKAKNTNPQDISAKFLRFIIKKFEARPDLLEPFTDMSKLDDASELVELLKTAFFPLTGDEQKQSLALSVPFNFQVFYATEAFRNTFYNELGHMNMPENLSAEKMQRKKLLALYGEILERFYHLKISETDDIIYTSNDELQDVVHHYRISIDKRFIEMRYTGDRLPELDKDAVCNRRMNILDLDRLQQLLPPDNFIVEGFAVLHVQEITQEYALGEIKNTILTSQDRDDITSYRLLEKSIKTLIGNKSIEVSILPVIKVNNKVVFEDVLNSGMSLLLKSLSNFGNLQKYYNEILDECGNELQPLVFSRVTDNDISEFPFLGPVRNDGYVSYVCYPIVANNELLGVLELASKKEAVLDHTFFSKLEPAFALLAQGLDGYRDRFDERLQKIIRDKFTSVQPAVEWKFYEQAWNYLRKTIKGEEAETENIIFENVHPIYGAVDVRNSSVERNYAIRKDITQQLTLVADTLSVIRHYIQLPLLEELEFKNQNLLQSLHEELSSEEELKLNDFIDNEIEPLFRHLQHSNDAVKKQVNAYFTAVNEHHGHTYYNRREYEESLDTINRTLSNYLDSEKEKIQKAYPSYFEKYRTDGIEYNIYIGQSIAPDKPFDMVYLKNLRLWQLRSMAEIAQLAHKLVPTLKVPLQTTQLILIHNRPIDISFRRDERKFDVEGAYNIRYEMIKKRIDKVHVEATQERLTQPGKIALVYTNAKEAEEYVQYINFLQNKNVLLRDLEYLDLEELQGVVGLKAIRVSVNLEN